MTGRIALAVALLCLTAAPAAADPVTLLTAAVSALLTETGIAIAVGLTESSFITLAAASKFIAGAIITGAAFLFGSMNGAQKIDPGKAKETIIAEATSEVRAVGRVRLGGVVAFGASRESRRYRLVLHAKSLDGIEQHFLGGREVVRNTDGDVTSKPYYISNAAYIRLLSDLGDPNKTAWSPLMTDFPALWTSDHRVRGIAQTLIRYTNPGMSSPLFLRLYQNGNPAYEVVARGEKVFDPRDGAQDADDPSTWLWSDNGILCALHIAATFPQLTYAHFNLAQIADEADRADSPTTTRTGTEPRARCWGVWPSETARGDLLAQVLTSIGAEIYTDNDGLFCIRLIDDARDAELEIAARHVVTMDWRSGPESVERPNICRVKYYSPERRFEMTEIDLAGIAWARIEDEIAAVGEQVMDLDLPFCPSAAQAQRIARRLFAMARADQVSITTNMVGMAAWGLKVVDFEVPDLETTMRLAIAPPRCRDSDGLVEIPGAVLPDLPAWVPATDEALPPAVVPDITYAGPSDTPPAPTASCVVTYPDASTETRVAVPAPSGGSFGVDVTAYECTYRTTDPLPSEWRRMTGFAGFGVTTFYIAGSALLGVPSEFHQRGSNNNDEITAWSPSYLAAPAVNNAAPAVPVLSYDSGMGTLTVRAPASLQVAYLRVTPPSGPATDHNVRPGESIAFPGAAGGIWSATARSSNHTASSPATALVS